MGFQNAASGRENVNHWARTGLIRSSAGDNIAELSLQQLSNLLNTLDWHKTGVDEAIWTTVSTGLRRRFDASKDIKFKS